MSRFGRGEDVSSWLGGHLFDRASSDHHLEDENGRALPPPPPSAPPDSPRKPDPIVSRPVVPWCRTCEERPAKKDGLCLGCWNERQEQIEECLRGEYARGAKTKTDLEAQLAGKVVEAAGGFRAQCRTPGCTRRTNMDHAHCGRCRSAALRSARPVMAATAAEVQTPDPIIADATAELSEWMVPASLALAELPIPAPVVEVMPTPPPPTVVPPVPKRMARKRAQLVKPPRRHVTKKSRRTPPVQRPPLTPFAREISAALQHAFGGK